VHLTTWWRTSCKIWAHHSSSCPKTQVHCPHFTLLAPFICIHCTVAFTMLNADACDDSCTLRRDSRGGGQGSLGLHIRCSPAPPHPRVRLQGEGLRSAAHVQEARRRHLHVPPVHRPAATKCNAFPQQQNVTLFRMYFVRSVDHPGAVVSGQRAHVVIAGFVAKYAAPAHLPADFF